MQSLVVVDDPMPYHIMPSSKPQQLTTMPPPNNLPTKRVRKRKIIEEDEYVSILENIIERDYFPDIPKLRAQLHYLENNEKFDLNTLKSIYSTLYSESDRVFPKMKVNTSHEFDSYSVDDNISVQSGSTVDCNTMTIDSFFRKYTSEDNESFEGIQKKNSEEFRRKFHWMYENMDHLMITNVGENRHIGSSVHKSILNGQQQQVQQQKKKAGMLMLYYIGDKVLTAQDRAKMDTILDEQMFLSHNETNSSVAQRVNGAENWPFRVRNQLFFPPEIQDSYATCQVPTADSSLEAKESGGDNADGKRRSALPITHDVQNTLLITDGAATSIAVNNNKQLALLQQTKFTANYNSRAEKVIQKSNTNLPNAWHLTPAQSHHLGYSSGGSLFSDYPPLNSSDQYSTVPMSPYVGASEGGVPGTPLLTVRGLEQHNGLLHQMHPPHSQQKVSLQDLTDEQLLERYQQLSARADSSAHQSAHHFDIQPAKRRELLGRALDTKGKVKRHSISGGKVGSSVLRGASELRSGLHSGLRSGLSSVLDTPLSVSSASSARTNRQHAGDSHSVASSSKQGSVYSSRRKLTDLTPAAQALALKLQKKRQSI